MFFCFIFGNWKTVHNECYWIFGIIKPPFFIYVTEMRRKIHWFKMRKEKKINSAYTFIPVEGTRIKSRKWSTLKKKNSGNKNNICWSIFLINLSLCFSDAVLFHLLTISFISVVVAVVRYKNWVRANNKQKNETTYLTLCKICSELREDMATAMTFKRPKFFYITACCTIWHKKKYA